MFGGELWIIVSPKINTVPGGPFGEYRLPRCASSATTSGPTVHNG
jgi:hypothetical protein